MIKDNRQGEVRQVKGQNGIIRTLEYDKLGRPKNARVTTVGSGVDSAVLRITRSYEVRGLLQNVTSYDNATVGSGNVVNDVQYACNGFMQLSTEYQSHSGAVNTSTSPKAQYAYADGGSNHARRTSMTSPDGTRLDYQYGAVGGAGDMVNRGAHLQSGNALGVDYSYLGVSTPVICGYSCEPSVELTYYTSGGSGDAGDQYTGLDRFGRVVDQRWYKTSDTTDRERLKYGYDRASNRQWRQNTVAATGQDEYYTYDGLYQVKNLDRGTLNAGKTGISGTPSWEEDWNYDPFGNWNGSSSAYLTKISGSTSLNQNRTHNVANELLTISTLTGTPWAGVAQDAAGNMTNAPQPLALGSLYDFIWDAWNRLVEVRVPGGFVARHAYDGANRRISKLTGSEFRHYYYSDQWQVIEERTGNNANADRRFFWGVRGVDDLICRDRGRWERLYALSDGLNITAVVDVTGAVQERYGYDGFGGVRYMDGSFGNRSSSSFDWETLFGSYRYDTNTGLYQVRYRYLHCKLGRWLSRDPIGEKGGLNLYEFAKNNAVNFIDRLGLCTPGCNRAGCAVRVIPAGYSPNTGKKIEELAALYTATERFGILLATGETAAAGLGEIEEAVATGIGHAVGHGLSTPGEAIAETAKELLESLGDHNGWVAWIRASYQTCLSRCALGRWWTGDPGYWKDLSGSSKDWEPVKGPLPIADSFDSPQAALAAGLKQCRDKTADFRAANKMCE